METAMNAQHIGASLDDFLTEEDLLEDATVIAVKRTIVWQIKKEMELQNITKTNLAKRMKTSRNAVNRLLDDSNAHLTLTMLVKAAVALNKTIRVELTN
jgi:predicted XRE-type DNA-binding protein